MRNNEYIPPLADTHPTMTMTTIPPPVDAEHWMRHALKLAEKAQQQNEVPVGAVLVNHNGEVLGEGFNQCIGQHDPSAHAEVMALRAAGQRMGNYRLPDSVLYVTLEPCPMCVGALLHARIHHLVFGAFDPKTGAAGSVFDLLADKRHYHTIQISSGVLQADCRQQLQHFFQQRRKAKKRHKNT